MSGKSKRRRAAKSPEVKQSTVPPPQSSTPESRTEPGLPIGLVVSRQQIIAQGFSGPLPPPDMLRQYDEIAPGAAQQILSQAAEQTKHRIAMEKKVTHWDIIRSFAGLVVGLVVALGCIVGGCILVYTGHDWAGATIATASVVGLVSVFVYGTSMRRSERTQRAKIMTGQE